MKKISVNLEEYLVQDIDGLFRFWNCVADQDAVHDMPFSMTFFKSRSEFISFLLHVAISDNFSIYTDLDGNSFFEFRNR